MHFCYSGNTRKFVLPGLCRLNLALQALPPKSVACTAYESEPIAQAIHTHCLQLAIVHAREGLDRDSLSIEIADSLPQPQLLEPAFYSAHRADI
jgi:hypothetical protein